MNIANALANSHEINKQPGTAVELNHNKNTKWIIQIENIIYCCCIISGWRTNNAVRAVVGGGENKIQSLRTTTQSASALEYKVFIIFILYLQESCACSNAQSTAIPCEQRKYEFNFVMAMLSIKLMGLKKLL